MLSDLFVLPKLGSSLEVSFCESSFGDFGAIIGDTCFESCLESSRAENIDTRRRGLWLNGRAREKRVNFGHCRRVVES